jgi:hypothetical protein
LANRRRFDMRLWKKIVAAYIVAAGVPGPYMIGNMY